MKKKLPLILLVIALVAGGVFAYTRFGPNSDKNASDKTQKRRISLPTNLIPLEERPYLKILPLADGRNVVIVVERVVKAATEVEYELEYQAGSLLQGAFGAMDLGTLPVEAKILFGSCSAGGACTYHEDVKGGSLVTTFIGGGEDYALKSSWKYIDNQAGETAFSSKDAKFQLESSDLKRQRFLIIFNNAGYPAGLKGNPISDPYSLSTSSAMSGSADLIMRANEEGELTIMGWDGKSWQEFKTTSDGKMATAKVELMELYIVVKK